MLYCYAISIQVCTMYIVCCLFNINSGNSLFSLEWPQGNPLNRCHKNARCINTHGSYKCECRRGFAGNGFDCEKSCFAHCGNGTCRCVRLFNLRVSEIPFHTLRFIVARLNLNAFATSDTRLLILRWNLCAMSIAAVTI